jgi:CheY-like chemotaxis protein
VNTEETLRPTLVPPIVRIVLTQATRLRAGGGISQTIFDEQIRRIDREELAPKGLGLLVRDLPGGRTRFLVKNKTTGSVCEMFEFSHDGTHESSDGSLRVLKNASAMDGASAPTRSPGAYPTSYARVLIVDDHVESADGFGRLLKRRGYQPRIAYDGPSAVEAADEFQPNIALLDIDLPGMDGCEVAEALRKNPAHWNCLLIAVTGFGEKELRARCAEAGFDYYLTKPVDLERLHALISDFLTAHLRRSG